MQKGSIQYKHGPRRLSIGVGLGLKQCSPNISLKRSLLSLVTGIHMSCVPMLI